MHDLMWSELDSDLVFVPGDVLPLDSIMVFVRQGEQAEEESTVAENGRRTANSQLIFLFFSSINVNVFLN